MDCWVIIMFLHMLSLGFLFHSEFAKIYEKLGVTLIERGESFYQEMMGAVVEDLENRGRNASLQASQKLSITPGLYMVEVRTIDL